MKSRFIRFIRFIIAVFPYIFKNHYYYNKNIVTMLIGSLPFDFPKFLDDNLDIKNARHDIYSLPSMIVYNCYFYKKYQKYELGENNYLIEFPDSYEGMKQYVKFIFDIQPEVLKIFTTSQTGVIDLITKYIFKIPKMLFVPRGLNYYEDYIFREKKSIIGSIRGYINKTIYKYCIIKSDVVCAAPIFAIENEILSKKHVYTSDYLLNCAVPPIKYMKEEKIIDKNLFNKLKEIEKFKYKIFTFSRVEKMKIGFSLDIFIQNKEIFKECCFIVIGDGSALEYYRNKYDKYNDIFFLGFVPKKQILPIIKHYDLMIAPHGGYSVIEVGLYGIPTVAYHYDLMMSTIYNNFNGYLIDKNTPEELIIVLKKHFAKTDEEIQKMRRNTIQSFNERFNLDNLEADKQKLVFKLKKCGNVK